MSAFVGFNNMMSNRNKGSLTKEDNSVRIAKEILLELDLAIKHAEENLRVTLQGREKQEAENEDGGLSWFLMEKRRSEPTQVERNEIARLAMNLRPCDFHSFVDEFRVSLEDETDAASVLRTLQVMLNEYMAAHSTREPGNKLLRLVRNLSNVTLKSYFGKRSPKVIPLGHENADQGNMVRGLSTTDQGDMVRVLSTADQGNMVGGLSNADQGKIDDRLYNLCGTSGACCEQESSKVTTMQDSGCEDDDYEYDSLNLGPKDLNIFSLIPNEAKYEKCFSKLV